MNPENQSNDQLNKIENLKDFPLELLEHIMMMRITSTNHLSPKDRLSAIADMRRFIHVLEGAGTKIPFRIWVNSQHAMFPMNLNSTKVADALLGYDTKAFPLDHNQALAWLSDFVEGVNAVNQEKELFRRLLMTLTRKALKEIDLGIAECDIVRLNPFEDMQYIDFIMENLILLFSMPIDSNTGRFLESAPKSRKEANPLNAEVEYQVEQSSTKKQLTLSFVRQNIFTESAATSQEEIPRIEFIVMREAIPSAMDKKPSCVKFILNITHAGKVKRIDIFEDYPTGENYSVLDLLNDLSKMRLFINYLWRHSITWYPNIMLNTFMQHNEIDTCIHYWEGMLNTSDYKDKDRQQQVANRAIFTDNALLGDELKEGIGQYILDLDNNLKDRYQALLSVFKLQNYVDPTRDPHVGEAHIGLLSDILKAIAKEVRYDLYANKQLIKDLISCGAFIYDYDYFGNIAFKAILKICKLTDEDSDEIQNYQREIFNGPNQEAYKLCLEGLFYYLQNQVKAPNEAIKREIMQSNASESEEESEGELSLSENESEPESEEESEEEKSQEEVTFDVAPPSDSRDSSLNTPAKSDASPLSERLREKQEDTDADREGVSELNSFLRHQVEAPNEAIKQEIIPENASEPEEESEGEFSLSENESEPEFEEESKEEKKKTLRVLPFFRKHPRPLDPVDEGLQPRKAPKPE